MKRNFKIKLFILFIFVFFFSRNVLAASLELNVEKNTIQAGEIFTATILLNTEGQSINTLEGDLKYDDKLIKAESVNIGNSFISFWVEKPDIKISGTIHFSGITPGGISASNSEVFKVMFRTLKTGNTSLLLNNVNLFLNDGKGSLVSTKITNANIKIVQGNGVMETSDVIRGDKIPPEKFNIIRTKDPSIFDNKYFIAFSTVDKGSGIDYYQVCEFFSCMTTESPFLLKNQTPFYRIAVKAYDMNGNFTFSALTSPWLVILLAFLLFTVIIIIYLCFYLRKNLTQK
jgi:hypothetical protein